MQGSNYSIRTYENPKNSEFSSNTNMMAGREDTEPLDDEEEEEDEEEFYDDDDFQDKYLNQSINVQIAGGVGSSSPHVFSLKEIGTVSSSPIGLTLRRTPSFLELLENSLFALSQARPSRDDDEGGSIRDRPRRRTDDVGSLPMSEKLKASNFPIKFINIGNWQRSSEHEGHLVAKLYYAKKKIVWEILVHALKNKIEMSWSDISAIRATMQENELGLLQIELNKPPSFFGETNPQPRKHTIWQLSSDFTEGRQASIFRIHTAVFPPGVLNSHYEKLLSCDGRLLELSQQPFPSQESPYFDLASLLGDSTLPLPCNVHRPSFASPVLQYTYPPHRTMATRATTSSRLTPSSATTVLNYPSQNELSRKMHMYTVGNQGVDWRNVSVGIERRQLVASQAQDNMAMITSSNYHRVATALNNIEEHLLGDHQVVYPDESTIETHVQSMCSTICPTDNPCPSRMNYRINHAASTSRAMMPNGNESYNVQRLHGFCSQGMNSLSQPPPPATPNDPIVMGPEVNNVVPSFTPNIPANVVLNRFMPLGNPTNRVGFPTAYCSRDSRIERN